MAYLVFPVIIPNQPPVMATTGLSTITYDQLVASFQNYYVSVDYLYLQGGDVNDLSQTFTLQKYNQSGNVDAIPDMPVINPTQYQSVYMWDLRGKGWVINNLTDLSITMQPFGTLGLIFFCKYGSSNDMINGEPVVDSLQPSALDTIQNATATGVTVPGKQGNLTAGLAMLAGASIIGLVLLKKAI